MLNLIKAFSSLSVNDIQKAREVYGKTGAGSSLLSAN